MQITNTEKEIEKSPLLGVITAASIPRSSSRNHIYKAVQQSRLSYMNVCHVRRMPLGMAGQRQRGGPGRGAGGEKRQAG